jgi:integrase
MGVFQKSGNWFIDYRLPNGKRRQEKIGTSKKLAETVLQKRKVAIAEGKFLDLVKNEKITFEAFAKEYLALHSRPHKKTWVTDEYHFKDLERFFGGKYLFAITAQDIEHFKAERLKERIGKERIGKEKKGEEKFVSTSTVNRQLATLRNMFNKAVSWGKLEVNPMKDVRSLKEPKGRLRFLEQEEIVKLLSNCNKKLKPIVVLALFTGMRRGEILGLKWPDIDFKRNIITLLDTKNGEKREVPMNGHVKTALIHIKRNPYTQNVFCDNNGAVYQDIRKSFSTALRKSGINDFRFHDLRHTFASQLVMTGANLNTVRELMGHKDITMTLRYSHLAPSYKQEAVDNLGKKVETFWRLEPSVAKSPKTRVSQVVEHQSFVNTGA